MKTKYRLRKNYIDSEYSYLEYQKEYKLLGVTFLKTWNLIPRVHYDKIAGRDEGYLLRFNKAYDLYITDFNNFNIERFCQTYPDIKPYLKFYKKAQKSLKESVVEDKKVEKESLIKNLY